MPTLFIEKGSGEFLVLHTIKVLLSSTVFFPFVITYNR